MATSVDRSAAAPTIPARVVIGVTGHRELGDEALLAARVREVLERIRARVPVPGTSRTALTFTLLSPLAEGADRLVARGVLAFPGSHLVAVLPLAAADYLEDFGREESRVEFERLLGQAQEVRVLAPAASRPEAYTAAGRHVVDGCDVLLALWNGAPAAGRAGTAEIVAYARRRDRPLYWIHSESGEVVAEREAQLGEWSLRSLDRYNDEPLDAARFTRCLSDAGAALRAAADAAGFSSTLVRLLERELLPHQVRSDLLSQRYQRRYLRAGTAVYAAAAAAVTVVAFQALFLPETPALLLIEVVLMSGILGILWVGKRQRWQGRWIDYRHLSERFRSSLFLAAAGVEIDWRGIRWRSGLAASPGDWVEFAFDSVRGGLPQVHPRLAVELESLRGFVLAAWIDDQVAYHRATGERYWQWQRRLEAGGTVLFALTFLAAVLHVGVTGPHWTHPLLSFVAMVLPAIGSALTAVRTHREYHRIAHRSTEMVRHLLELREHVQATESIAGLRALLREVAAAMLHENDDWRVVVRLRPAELPV